MTEGHEVYVVSDIDILKHVIIKKNEKNPKFLVVDIFVFDVTFAKCRFHPVGTLCSIITFWVSIQSV